MKHKLTMIVGVLALAGCASSKHDARDDLLMQPINCETAVRDIAALEALMPSGMERVSSGVRSVTPAGIVTGAIAGENSDKRDVASGRTGQALETRITEIERQCLSEAVGNGNQESASSPI